MARPKKNPVIPPVPAPAVEPTTVEAPTPPVEVESERPTVKVRNHMTCDFHYLDYIFRSGETLEIPLSASKNMLSRPIESYLIDAGKLELLP